jgi:hypothetical protein
VGPGTVVKTVIPPATATADGPEHLYESVKSTFRLAYRAVDHQLLAGRDGDARPQSSNASCHASKDG